MSVQYAFTTIDDVQRILDKLPWISSYEIFYQNLIEVRSEIQLHTTDLKKIENEGLAIRIISREKKFSELVLGTSSIAKLLELEPPKSTQIEINASEFRTLKRPRKASIEGDQGASIDVSKNLIISLMDKFEFVEQNERHSITTQLTLNKETSVVTNSGSKPIPSVSLRLNYNLNLTNNEIGMSVNRGSSSRNTILNHHDIYQEANKALEAQSFDKITVREVPNSIIFHPEVLGRLISFHSATYLFDSPDKRDIQLWDESLYLYDDPLRDFGYGSYLIDDEGALTRSRTLIENGIHSGGLVDLSSSNFESGGNGYRAASFQPLLRSYKYTVNRNISNLVLIGGTGKGSRFTERSGETLVIKRGHGFLGGTAKNPQFTIHSSETELWKNGIFQGPTQNFTVSGSLDQILKQGDLSSDLIQVVDAAIPGAVYIGWLRCHRDYLRIRL